MQVVFIGLSVGFSAVVVWAKGGNNLKALVDFKRRVGMVLRESRVGFG